VNEVDRLLLDAARPWPGAEDRRSLHDRVRAIDEGAWASALDTAGRLRIAALVWWNVRGSSYDIPVVARQYLQALFLFHRRRNAALADEIAAVATAFADADVPVLFRKGAFLAFHRYPDPGTRPMGDVDLLIRPGDRVRVPEVLRSLGYASGRLDAADRVVRPHGRAREAYYRMYTSNLPPMKRPMGDPHLSHVMVDAVTSLLPPGSGCSVDPDELLERSTTVLLGGAAARVLVPEDFLLDLCAHTFKESTTLRYLHRGGHRRLIQHSDVQALVHHPAAVFDWESFMDRALRHGVATPCYFTLGNHDRLFPGTIPDFVLRALGAAAGRDEDFLDEYGHLELADPLRWTEDVVQRVFSGSLPDDLPATKSLV